MSFPARTGIAPPARSRTRAAIAAAVSAVLAVTFIASQAQSSEAAESIDLARTGTATAKSTYLHTGDPAGYAPANAIDGDDTTRWGSRYTRTNPADTYDPRNDWLQVDLPTSATIERVVVKWEAAASVDYFVQVSTDGGEWVTVANPKGSGARTDDVAVQPDGPVDAVRILSNDNATRWGLSVFTFQIWGNAVDADQPADLTEADSRIADARALLATTPVGTEIGSAPQSAHTDLQNALNAAEAARESAVTQADADAIVSDLDSAIATFEQLVSVVNEPDPTDPEVTYPDPGRDVASDGIATAKSTYLFTGDPAGYSASNAIDGDSLTRWGSRYTRTNPTDSYDATSDWLQVQLAEPTVLHHVVVVWEGAASTDYFIQGSSDGSTWKTLANPKGTGARTDEVMITDTAAYSYVRVLTNGNASKWGLSIFSFEVWNGPAPIVPVDASAIVPTPVTQIDVEAEPYALGADARIAVSDAALSTVADILAAQLRRSTGFQLPIVTGSARAGDIALVLGDPATTAAAGFQKGQAYRLRADAGGVTLTASTPRGAFNGSRSLLQLLPPFVFSAEPVIQDWIIPATEVEDFPRIAQRGLMIDPARSFVTVDEMKSIIDRLAQIKGNRLHLHLTDDEGWRLEIPGYPRLTEYGATSSWAGPYSDGRPRYYSLDDFREIVRYANDRFIEVIPEIDIPGHSDAATASYPEFVCDELVDEWQQKQNGIPIRDHRRNATFIPLYTTKPEVIEFLGTVFDTLDEVSTSDYVHIGADEVDTKYISKADFGAFIQKMEAMLAERGKRMIGWTPVPAYAQLDSSVHQYWADRKNEIPTPAQDTGKRWYSRDTEVVVSPTNHAYLDYGFESNSWSWKGTRWTTQNAYSWDPSSIVDETTRENQNSLLGLKESQITAVEGAYWGERAAAGLPAIDYQVWVRETALSEKGWTPKENDDWETFRSTLGTMGSRWAVQGVNFYADPAVSWAPAGAGKKVVSDDLVIDDVIGLLSHAGSGVANVTAQIEWGDGTQSTATLRGTDAVKQKAAELTSVSGQHTYSAAGVYRGSITAKVGSSQLMVPFIAEVGPPPSLVLSAASVTVGDDLTITATGLRASESVTVSLQPGDVHIGSADADASGAATLTWAVPATTRPGDHQVVLTRADGSTLTVPVTILAAEEPPADCWRPPGKAHGWGDGVPQGLERGRGPATPPPGWVPCT
ncbi:family 20 glycosylhydrolase [Microbacterium sp.]|uniref:family 20 glycosylhydrolase n=1 Tax=Microbacterium sp. TaxID=51671 RepID=UPI002810B3AF|nr:family 20 glycosylhydrolase [Microbacterium sp.]